MQVGDGRSMFATPLDLEKSLSITEDGSLKQNKPANILWLYDMVFPSKKDKLLGVCGRKSFKLACN